MNTFFHYDVRPEPDMLITNTYAGYVAVGFHYSQRIVEAIKGFIPASYRSYDHTTHTWFVSPLAETQFRAFLGSVGYKHMEMDAIAALSAERAAMKIRKIAPVFLAMNPFKDRGTEQTSYSPALDGTMVIIPMDLFQAFYEPMQVKSPVVSQIHLDTSSYYTILGVSPNSSDSDITTAYKRCARLYHPDVNPDPGAHTAFVTVKGAYDVLSDGKKRKKYDFAISHLGAGNATQKGSAPMDDIKYGWIYEDAAKVIYAPNTGPCMIEMICYELFDGRFFAKQILNILPWSPTS